MKFSPRGTTLYWAIFAKKLAVDQLKWILSAEYKKLCNRELEIADKLLRIPWLSIREATLTVSPNKQYLGIDKPTTPLNWRNI